MLISEGLKLSMIYLIQLRGSLLVGFNVSLTDHDQVQKNYDPGDITILRICNLS